MATMKNEELNILYKVMEELKNNDGKLSSETISEYSKLVESFEADRIKRNKKTWEHIKEKRKTDKNYGRPKKQKKQNNE